MNTKIPALLCLLMLALAHAASRADDAPATPDADGWLLVRGDDYHDIHAYARQEGSKSQRSFKVDATIKGKPEDLAAALLDFANYPKWFLNLREARLLRQVSPTEYYVYMTYDAPYPLTPRDCVLHVIAQQQTKADPRFILSVGAAPGYLPTQPDYVRMPANQFSVVFQPRADGMIETHVNGYMDLGGSVPGWAADLLQQEEPYYTVRGLQRVVEHPKDINRTPLPFAVYSYQQLLSLATR